jgi:hypothetical protein
MASKSYGIVAKDSSISTKAATLSPSLNDLEWRTANLLQHRLQQEQHSTKQVTGFRYLKATSTMGITYDGSDGLELEGYCDADYADQRELLLAAVVIVTAAESFDSVGDEAENVGTGRTLISSTTIAGSDVRITG